MKTGKRESLLSGKKSALPNKPESPKGSIRKPRVKREKEPQPGIDFCSVSKSQKNLLMTGGTLSDYFPDSEARSDSGNHIGIEVQADSSTAGAAGVYAHIACVLLNWINRTFSACAEPFYAGRKKEQRIHCKRFDLCSRCHLHFLYSLLKINMADQ